MAEYVNVHGKAMLESERMRSLSPEVRGVLIELVLLSTELDTHGWITEEVLVRFEERNPERKNIGPGPELVRALHAGVVSLTHKGYHFIGWRFRNGVDWWKPPTEAAR